MQCHNQLADSRVALHVEYAFDVDTCAQFTAGVFGGPYVSLVVVLVSLGVMTLRHSARVR